MILHFQRNTFSIFASSLFAALAFLMILATFIELEGRQSVGMQRSPAYSAPEDATMVYRQDGATIDGKNVSVMYYEPLSAQGTVPPGLQTNLAPGTVAISPALTEDKETIAAQYGQISAEIDSKVLLSENEALIYFRPENSAGFRQAGLEERGAFPARGFGSTDSYVSMGDAGYEYNAGALWILEILLVLSVALIYLIQSRRRFLARAAPQLLILERLGARPHQIVASRFHAVWKPLAFALGISAVLCAWFVLIPVRLPFNGFVTRPEFYQTNIPLIILVLVLVSLALLGMFTLPAKTRATRQAPRRKYGNKFSWLSIALMLFGLTVIAFCSHLLRLQGTSDVVALILYFGILLVLVGTPGVLATVLRFVVSTIGPKFTGRLNGIFLSWADRHAVHAMLQGSVFAIFLIAGSVVALLYVAVSTPLSGAGNISDAKSAVEVRSGCRASNDPDCVKNLASEIVTRGDSETVVALIPDFADNKISPAVISGDTDALAANLDDGQLSLLLNVTQSAKLNDLETLDIKEIPDEGTADFLIMSSPGQLTLETYSGLPANSDSIKPAVSWYGEGDYAAQSTFVYHSRWVLWLGGIGFLIMMTALSQIAITEQQLEARRFAPLVALNGRAGLVARAMRTRCVTTTVTGTAMALILGFATCVPFVLGGDGNFPIGYFIALSTIFVTVQLMQQGLAEHFLKNAAQAWKPGDSPDE